MQKLPVLLGFVFIVGLFSCSKKPDKLLQPVSVVNKINAETDSLSEFTSVETLLPELPLLKFPLVLDVDSFRDKKAIPLALDKNLPWFSSSTTFQPGTKLRAIGKFYINMKTIAVLYFVSFDGQADELPDKEELFLSIYNTETGAVNSRSFAVKSEGIDGNAVMKNPETLKKIMQIETTGLNLAFQSFDIKNDGFVLVKSKGAKFALNEKGRMAADQQTKNWLK